MADWEFIDTDDAEFIDTEDVEFLGSETDFAIKQNAISRTPCALVIITLDVCSLVYGVGACTAAAAAGSECYNTFPTCQDKTNFDRTTKDYKFTSLKAPLPFKTGERPYVSDIRYNPTEIKDSETVRGRVSVEMVDEPDTDIGIDTYVATRASVQGNFWKKLLARNPNYKGRPIKIYDGFIGLSEWNFTTGGKRFNGIIDNITLNKGSVKIEAVDLLKILDDVDIPAKVSVYLSHDIDASVLQMTLRGADMPDLDATGYLRINDEIIYYGALATASGIISSCVRAQYDTTAATHSNGAKIQPVKIYTVDNPFDMMQTILTDAGIDTGDIDDTAFDTEKAFVDDPDIEAVISDPTSAKDLYFELIDLLNCKSWVSEDLKITIARILPNHPDWTLSTITDDINIIVNSASVDLHQKSLITRCAIFWDPDAAEPSGDQDGYRRLTIAIDADAEGVNEYNTIAEKKILSRWLRHGTAGSTEEEQAGWIASLAIRNVWQSRDPMPIITLNVEMKDGSILTGNYLTLSTDEIQDADGNDLDGVSFQVVSREKIGNNYKLKCLRLTPKRVCYFAPAAAPDFDAATAAEKRSYGYFTQADGMMADLTNGYMFF